jgi:hypothetical protein
MMPIITYIKPNMPPAPRPKPVLVQGGVKQLAVMVEP